MKFLGAERSLDAAFSTAPPRPAARRGGRRHRREFPGGVGARAGRGAPFAGAARAERRRRRPDARIAVAGGRRGGYGQRAASEETGPAQTRAAAWPATLSQIAARRTARRTARLRPGRAAAAHSRRAAADPGQTSP